MKSPARSESSAQPSLSVLLCHFAFWFGLLFATPLFVATHNQVDLVFSLSVFSIWAGVICILFSIVSWKVADLFGSSSQWWICRILLTAAIIMAVQSNIIHDLFNYGAFNGEKVNYHSYGWKFWAEWLAWLLAFPVGVWLLSRVKKLPPWLPVLPIVSFVLLVTPALMNSENSTQGTTEDEGVDPSVFEFSSAGNLIHLLPDGLQGDVVRQVFEENPALAEKFKGFTLFTDHVGTNHGTAPAMYTMLTGKAFDLKQGFNYKDVIPDIEENSYQKELASADYRLDYVPITGFICPKTAASCIVRPFNDMKARGFYRHQSTGIQYSVRLVADLSLFRLVPMFLKEKIYNNGEWFLADTTLDGSSPWPDPVIREWTEHMTVINEQPVYKWHHFIGTHIPAKWDSDCSLLKEPAKDRDAYLGQAACILTGIGHFLDRLEEKGIYEQTAMIISGDHGHNTVPDDLASVPLNSGLSPGLLGSGRPALLVKQKDSRKPLTHSTLPTSVMDIKPTALDLAGIETLEPSAFEIPLEEDRDRYYRVYSTAEFYTGNPIPYVEYRVGRPAHEGSQWRMTDVQTYTDLPDTYAPLNRPNAQGFVFGARLRKSMGNNNSAWITGRQLAFVIGLPDSPASKSLALSLHIPEWMGEQTFSARINHGQPWQSPVLNAGSRFWQEIEIPVPNDIQNPRQIFVSLVFGKLLSPPDVDNMKASALIQSIKVMVSDPIGQTE